MSTSRRDLQQRAWATRRAFLGAVLAPLCLCAFGAALAQAPPAEPDAIEFLRLSSADEALAAPARQHIAAAWRDGYAAMIVDLLDIMRRTSLVQPQSWITFARLAEFLEQRTGQAFGSDVDAWRQWVWSLPYEPHPDYGPFKGALYARLDPAFAEFFRAPANTTIRLDEVQWGGVPVNGIPPLDHPAHLAAADADYLAADNVVFGVFVDGEARAYPQRILAWHELALDRVGQHELTIVYCTLCGTVIPYDSSVGGKLRKFGTSGLLYQSNKLMFDHETKSLWSSISGMPVVGPLVGSGLVLTALPVVTTTWAEWRRRHPDTSVLSLDTGFSRDYSEGAAYRQYFATDNLMFDVSRHDRTLPNKAEVLVLRLANPGRTPKPVAISAEFLREHRSYLVDVAKPPLVVITSAAGANRVYETGGHRFAEPDEDSRVLDENGRAWIVDEDALIATFDPSQRLKRVPAHRAFWFGWYAQAPDTLLIK
jgi:Protein of unknown function (DUF3179)